MSGGEWAVIIVAVITTVGTIAGTTWTKRRSGPEFTAVNYDNLMKQINALRDDRDKDRIEMRALREELDVERQEVRQLREELIAARQSRAVDRVWIGMLIQAMEEASITVPDRPDEGKLPGS